MIRRANQPKHGAQPADLLVCFPSRAHLTLIPKKLSSPARLMDASFHHRRHHSNQLKKLPSTKLGQTSSPTDLWDKATKAGTDVSEPSSPKVTCAGQIKVRSRSRAANCESWQSVMEEIERIHRKSKNEKKRASWGDALGIKKDAMQFLTCLRNIKLDFRCFGAVPECKLSSDEDEDEEEEEESQVDHNKKNINQSSESNCKEDIEIGQKDSKTAFSNWFMVLQDVDSEKDADAEPHSADAPPPPNALLLMRCRSAPGKSWLENRAKALVEEQEERDHKEARAHRQDEEEADEEVVEGEENVVRKKLRDYLFVMDEYDTEFYKLSNDIAKETWVVGSINPFSRSRSWKR